MKKSELFFSVLQVPVDFLMIICAAASAFAIRNIPQIITLKPKLYNFPFDQYLKVVVFVAFMLVLIYAVEGLYVIRSTRRFWRESFRVFAATSLGLVVVVAAIFLKREWFSSRFIILAGWFLTVFYVVAARYFLHSIQKFLLVKKGIGVHRLLLIGGNGKMASIRNVIEKNPSLGYRIIGETDNTNIRFIKEIKKEKGIDEIILCNPAVTDQEQEKIIDYCSINNINFKYLPTIFHSSRAEVAMLNGNPIIEVKNTPLEGWGSIIKRVFDITGSLFLLIIFSPLMALTALAIRIDSNGPIIYRNERIGNDGKKFFVYKFRYMKWECCITRKNENLGQALELEKKLIEKRSVRQGPLYKIKDDPRKTRVGKIIERYSIDELPQFFNVLKGEMSLVGPRPHQAREVEKYKEYHRRLLTIKPGITGMAQISGRSDLDFETEYKLDIYYIENWSLWLDILICLKTPAVLFRRRKNSR